EYDWCSASPSSTHAIIKRIRKRLPVEKSEMRLGILPDCDLGRAKAGEWLPIGVPAGVDPWYRLGRELGGLAMLLETKAYPGLEPAARGRNCLCLMVAGLLGVAPP